MQSEVLVIDIICLESQFVDLPRDGLTEVKVATSDDRARKNFFEGIDSNLFEVSGYVAGSQLNVENLPPSALYDAALRCAIHGLRALVYAVMTRPMDGVQLHKEVRCR